MKLLIFRLDATRYAIPLETVERVIRAVAVTPVREESSTLWGVINLRGEIVPVIDTRRLLGLSERDLELEDVFVDLRGICSLPSWSPAPTSGLWPWWPMPPNRWRTARRSATFPPGRCFQRLDTFLVLPGWREA